MKPEKFNKGGGIAPDETQLKFQNTFSLITDSHWLFPGVAEPSNGWRCFFLIRENSCHFKERHYK